jgi:hypothetical protein
MRFSAHKGEGAAPPHYTPTKIHISAGYSKDFGREMCYFAQISGDRGQTVAHYPCTHVSFVIAERRARPISKCLREAKASQTDPLLAAGKHHDATNTVQRPVAPLSTQGVFVKTHIHSYLRSKPRKIAPKLLKTLIHKQHFHPLKPLIFFSFEL